MKTSFYLTAICLVALSMFLVWTKVETNYHHNISLTISEDEDTYALTARYNPEDTRRVEGYINDNIAPNTLGASEHDYVDTSTTLRDNTEFYIKESPGLLKIKFEKRKNSSASYLRIKRMCEGVKDVLGGK